MSIQTFADEKVAFLFHVYKEFDLARRLIRQIKFFFPSSDILGISDGTTNDGFRFYCHTHNVKYLEHQRLFYQTTGNQWIKRMFRFFQAYSEANYLIKIDPDSYVLRRFEFLPDLDISGTPFKLSDKISFVHGGCALYSKYACQKILDTNLIDANEYRTNMAFAYRRFMAPYKQRNEEAQVERFFCEDRVLGDVGNKLGLRLGEWTEICADQSEKKPEDYTDMKYAVIHAVKQLLP